VPPADPDPDLEQGSRSSSNQASQRLLKSDRDPYRSLFDQSPLPMLICDVGTLRVLAANEQAAKLHRASPEQMVGTTLFELRRVSDLTQIMLKRAVGHEIALGFGYHTRKDGTTFAVQVSVHPAEFDGRPVWLCQLKSLEEVLTPRDSDHHRRMLEAIGRIAGGVAHDINNLLSVILSFTSLATSQLPQSSSAQADLGEIRGAAERASSLTKQLLSLSRRGPITPKPLQLNDLVKRLEKQLRRLLEDQVALELSLDPELDQVLADSAQLERLLVQLVSESRSSGGRGGKLTLETRNFVEDGVRQVVLQLHDDTNSLTPELAALADLGGSGNSWLETEAGCGARFVACFPSLVTPRPGSVTGERKQRPESVLVVQDNPHLRKTLKTYFAREGYRVLDADSSLEALRLAEREPRIDLLLTDFSLPDGTGPELGRALREHLPELKVLIAIGHPDQRATLRADHRTALINKPFDLQQFGELIERLLEASDAQR
jgi:two-component system, cell cycle sensor histidine kinase and response regulator CckA